MAIPAFSWMESWLRLDTDLSTASRWSSNFLWLSACMPYSLSWMGSPPNERRLERWSLLSSSESAAVSSSPRPRRGEGAGRDGGR